MIITKEKLIIFDVGAILLETKMGCFKDLLVILGKEKEVKAIDEEYQKRKKAGPWGMEQLANLYKGFSEEELKKVTEKYCQKSLKEDVKECFQSLKEKDYILGVISGNPQFVIDWLIDNLPLDFAKGTELEFKNGIASGNLQTKVDRYVKVEILKEKIKEYQIDKKNVIIVGDSITSLPMVELAGKFFAFLPKEDVVKEKAIQIIKDFQELKNVL